MAQSFVVARNYGQNPTPGKVAVKLDANVNAEIGNMLVQVAGYGQVPAAANAATGHMVGVVIEDANNTGGAQGAKTAVCDVVTAAFANSLTNPCSQATVGALVYAASGTVISSASADGPKAGKLIAFDPANPQGRPCIVALDCMLTA